MKRRTVLALASSSLVALAGCLGGDDETGTDEGPVGANGNDGANGDDGANGEDDLAFDSPTEGAKTLLETLAAEEYEDAIDVFSEEAREFAVPAQLEANWRAFLNTGGAFEAIQETEETADAGFDAVDVTVAFERSEHRVRIVVDASNAPQTMFLNDEYQKPDYADADAFDVTTSEFERDGCLMDAIITVPADADGDVPGVLLVHGSDPLGIADMDLTTGIPQLPGDGSKPFTDIAEGLASQGVAVYRYDRRTFACNVDPAAHTLDGVVFDDALAALADFRDVAGVDADRIVVAGLSLGGMAVPRIADRDGNLAGGVALAAPGRSFYESTLDQLAHLSTVTDLEWEQAQNQYEDWQDRVDRIRDGDYSPEDLILDHPGALWESLDEYDHRQTACDIDVPLLFLQGDRDYQVTVEDDLATWENELDGREDTQFETYEGLNHLFQFGDGPSVPDEYGLYNPVNEAVVTDIASWVAGR